MRWVLCRWVSFQYNTKMFQLRNRNLGHRLSLFVFFWNATKLPKRRDAYHFTEPFRIVLIIRPRLAVLRVYYNQATPHDRGELKLVNWYDANSLGLFKVPLLPSSKDVYRNFAGRVLSIPIIHVRIVCTDTGWWRWLVKFSFSLSTFLMVNVAVTTLVFRQISELLWIQWWE